MAGTDDDDGNREPIARNVGEDADVEPDNTDRCSTGGGVGDTDTRDGMGVCPMDASGGGGAAGGIDDRGKRTVDAWGEGATDDGMGVGLRKPGTGVGLRITGGVCGVGRLSVLGGCVDLRVNGDAEGGSGVMRFSGGGIVDLRDDDGLVDGGGVDTLREDAGSTDERAGTASSSTASSDSPPRGSAAGICVEERRDEPRAELCG